MIRKPKIMLLILMMVVLSFSQITNAAITDEQGKDVAEFAKKFIEEGNNRRDEKGYPLLTYALSGNWNTCVEIRSKGYNEELYYIKRNGYHIKNGKYVELGNKWCMDCGTFVTYTLHRTLGVDLYNEKEPWHVQDIYNDALKDKNSKNFEFVYKSIAVGRIDYSKLKPGDVIARVTPGGNHGMLYVGDGMIAHANRDMITYKAPAVFGFQVSKLNRYYKSGTPVSVIRIKDGVVPEDVVVNSIITWPDNGETVDLLQRPVEIVEEKQDNTLLLLEEMKKLEKLNVETIKLENVEKDVLENIDKRFYRYEMPEMIKSEFEGKVNANKKKSVIIRKYKQVDSGVWRSA